MFDKNYFTSGEFAKICNIEKHVLFHYDDIGLFQPAIVKENGYRYYSYRQYDTFCMISVLKDLGMSLKDIKIYLQQRSPDEFLRLLEEKEKDIHQEIKKLARTQNYIHMMHRSIKEAITASKEAIIMQKFPQTYLLCSRDVHKSQGHSFKDYTKEYVNFYQANRLAQEETIGTMLRIDCLRQDEFADFACLYTKSKHHRNKNIYIRACADYLTTYHHGSYETIYLAYHRLLSYADTHNISLGEFAFEEYVVGDIAQKDSEQYITLILMEIKAS